MMTVSDLCFASFRVRLPDYTTRNSYKLTGLTISSIQNRFFFSLPIVAFGILLTKDYPVSGL